MGEVTTDKIAQPLPTTEPSVTFYPVLELHCKRGKCAVVEKLAWIEVSVQYTRG